MKIGTRVFNMYHGRGTVIEMVHKPAMTSFGKRGTFKVAFDYPELDQSMNTAQLIKLKKNDCGKEIGNKGRGRRVYRKLRTAK